ncbi:hypothetical protein ACEPPN_005167 [Leptodophora sp. 'Broadleaf-Isolate-01']
MTQQSGEEGKNVLKHNREDDDDDDGDRSSKTKRSRIVPREQTPLFACHFRKKDTERYGNPQSRWYKHCSSPCSSDLRRIKNHFKKRHRLSHCENCGKPYVTPVESVTSQPCTDHTNRTAYGAHSIMSDMDEGLDSRAPEENPELLSNCCSQPYIVRSDIDKEQWERIQDVLSKKGKRSLQKSKTELEKWYDVWEILFPSASGIPVPTNPWAESSVVAGSVMNGLADFERFLEAEMNSSVSGHLFHQMQQILEAFKRSVAQERAPPRANQYATFDYFPDPALQTSQTMEDNDSTISPETSSSNSASTATVLSNTAWNCVASNAQRLQQDTSTNELSSPAAPVYLPFQSDYHQSSPQSGSSLEPQPFLHQSLPLSSVSMWAPLLLEQPLLVSRHTDDQNDFALNSGTGYSNYNTDNAMSSSFDFEHELDFMIAHSSEPAIYPNDQELELWQYGSGI